MEQILIQKIKRKDSETLRNILKRNNMIEIKGGDLLSLKILDNRTDKNL